MAKTRNRSGRRAGSAENRAVSAQQQATEMCALARHLTHDFESPNAVIWDEQLTRLIEKQLQSGRDEVLELALQKAAESGDSGIIDELFFNVSYAAQTRAVGHTLASGSTVFGTLFAAPVWIANIQKLDNGKIVQGAQFDELAKSLRACSLVKDSESVCMLNYLYHPEELNFLGWSGIARLTQMAGQQLMLNAPAIPEAILGQRGAPPVAEIDSETTILGVRYLLFVITSAASQNPPLTPPQKQKKYDQWISKVEKWQESAKNLLSKALGSKRDFEVSAVGLPDEYFSTMDASADEAATMAIQLKTKTILRDTGISPEKIKALIALYVTENDESLEIAASLISQFDGSLLGVVASKVEVGDNPDDTLDILLDCLKENSINDVKIVEELVTAQACEGCGAQMYVAPAEDEASSLTMAHVHTELPHERPHLH